MFNRTLQLQDLAEGRECDFSYNPECLITTSDNKYLVDKNVAITVETTFSNEFTLFMEEIENIRQMIRTIDEGSESILKLMSLSHDVVNEKQNMDISTSMNALIDRTNLICTQCKDSITGLEKFKNDGTSSTEARMRLNSYNVVVKHFRNSMKRYQDSQVDFKKSITDRAKRQIQLIYPDMKPEEVDQIMVEARGHQTVEQIAKSNFLSNVSLKDAVSNIQGKYNDILALEQSMEQLRQMMVELAGVVSYQGELIDQIEHNALKAVDYTGRANLQLMKAKENKRKGGKMLMWFTIILIAGGISVMIPIILKVT